MWEHIRTYRTYVESEFMATCRVRTKPDFNIIILLNISMRTLKKFQHITFFRA